MGGQAQGPTETRRASGATKLCLHPNWPCSAVTAGFPLDIQTQRSKEHLPNKVARGCGVLHHMNTSCSGFALRCSQEPPPVVGHTHRLRRDARTGPTGHQQPMTTTWTRPSGLTRHDHCAVKHCWSMYSSPPLPPPSREATQARPPGWAPTTVPGSAPHPLLRVAKHQVTLPASIALNQYRVNHSKHDTDPDWVPTVRAGGSGPGRDIACSPRQTHTTTHTQHVALWEHVHTAPCTYAHGTGPAEGCCQGTPSSITAMAYQAVQVCRWQHRQPTKGLDLPWNRDTSCRTKV